MDHPFIGSLQDKTLEEVQASIDDLTKKLNMAHRMRHTALINQLQLAIGTYRAAYSQKTEDAYRKRNIKTKVDVSS